MITHWPGPDGTPDEPDATLPVPDDVWRKFLCDSEHAIRRSAPREPSARERRQGFLDSDDACHTTSAGNAVDTGTAVDTGSSIDTGGAVDTGVPADTDRTAGAARTSPEGDGCGPDFRGRGSAAGGGRSRRRPVASDPVDGVWGPDDPWAGPAWRELDGRARLRRAGRVIATAAAITLALGAWSHLTSGAGAPAGGGPQGTTVEQLDEVSEELPATRRVPPGSGGEARASPPPSASD